MTDEDCREEQLVQLDNWWLAFMGIGVMIELLACCPSIKSYDIASERGLSRPYYRPSAHLSSENPYGQTRLSASSVSPKRGLQLLDFGQTSKGKWKISAVPDIASAVDVINDLGMDTLTFLMVTVLIVPAFKLIRASSILGFFIAGVVLNQFGLIRNLTDVKILSEWGILFLLFEMGLELSLARLKALAKFAFGMGLTQVLLSTLAFTAFELPPNGAIGTKILQFLFHSRSDLVNIRSIDEAIVIGAALSLSSSAFVLQLLAEKGELPTRLGSATLGILLFQDIAVVPLLVILPVLESQNLAEGSIWPALAKESLKALGGLGIISFGGKFILRRVFEVVAEARSSEAFVAMCLLTVAGTSLLTQKLGFSDTLGAFLAGALLAETNFRTQIEADIRPFRGLLLGLFFVTTGTSIDTQLLIREWPNVLSLLGGLIAIKTLIITAIGPRVGLSLRESVRIGFLLSQGGEFGFVVFSLANRLGVLPLELNKLLIIVVVLSMALTPLLNELGRRAADYIDENIEAPDKAAEMVDFNAMDPVVILGFDQTGQILANFLSTPLASGLDGNFEGWPYVAFELDLSIVKASRKLGFPVLYGDGSRPAVLQSAGISSPKAVMIMYTGRTKTTEAVQRTRLAFPAIPIYARAQDLNHLLELKQVGATDAILENTESSLQLGSKLLQGLGVMSDDVSFLSKLVRESMEIQAQEALYVTEDREANAMKPLQLRVADILKTQSVMTSSPKEPSLTTRESDKALAKDVESNGKPELPPDDTDDDNGVLFCDLDTDNNIISVKIQTDVPTAQIDPSMLYINSTSTTDDSYELVRRKWKHKVREGKENKTKGVKNISEFAQPNPSEEFLLGMEAVTESSSSHSWFTPKRLLALFCTINLLNYVDRGTIASNGVNGERRSCTEDGTCSSGSGIQGDFNLSDFEDGLLSSAFMVGLLIASPIFASLAKSFNPFRLIGVGLSVWIVAVTGCGFSFNFWSIAICRMLVGVGEASFISLAAPFIDDNAPPPQKAAWLGVFYMCIPSGIALGYVYGGLIGSYFNWRYAFFGEAILMVPFVVLGFAIKPLQLKGFTSTEPINGTGQTGISVAQDKKYICLAFASGTEVLSHHDTNVGTNCQSSNWTLKLKIPSIQLSIFFEDMKMLLAEKVYVVNVLGYIAYNFVIGAYSYWGPKAGYSIYHMEDADYIFGGMTIVCGIIGTLAGGFVLDYMTSTISNAFKLLSVTTLFGAIFCFGAFCFKSLYGFLVFFSIGEILVFATQGPVNYISLHSVKPSMRPLSMAISTVSIHIFGDVPSSPLVGILQDSINNWRETSLILTSVLFIAAGVWFMGIFTRSSVDKSTSDRSYITPLLATSSSDIQISSHELTID
ncbi:unnamed protein product [Rhodiola kirilowii]